MHPPPNCFFFLLPTLMIWKKKMYLVLEITTLYLLLDYTVHNRSKCCIWFRSSYTIGNSHVHIEGIDIIQKYESAHVIIAWLFQNLLCKIFITICSALDSVFVFCMIDGKEMFFIYSFPIKVDKRVSLFCSSYSQESSRRCPVGLERSPRKRKVGCSNPSRDRPKL